MLGAEWLELLCKRIPDRYDRGKSLWDEHPVRYCGWYSNCARGERAKAPTTQDLATQPAASVETVSEFATRAKWSWQRFHS